MLSVTDLNFTYQKEFLALENISFTLKKGAILGVVGESGCGKSTLLEVIYGLLEPTSGDIIYREEKLLGADHHLVPGHTFMKYVAQDFDLMPFISVKENIGKFLSAFYPEARDRRVDELLEVMELATLKNTHVRYLSGGQKQRVALARALAKAPEVLLLDEPFSHIDSFKKNSLRRSLFSFIKKNAITCIVATHETTDMLSFAEELLVLQNGKIVRKGKSKELYDAPQTPYVAALFGQINILPTQLFDPTCTTDNMLILYANDIKLTENLSNAIRIVVEATYFLGSYYLIQAKTKKESVRLYFTNPTELTVQTYCSVTIDPKLLKIRSKT